MTKIIFLDAAGTLFDVRGSVGEVYGQLAKNFGVTAKSVGWVEVTKPNYSNPKSLVNFLLAPLNKVSVGVG